MTVRATFPNEDGRLRPGMFANVEVLSAEQAPVLLVPAPRSSTRPTATRSSRWSGREGRCLGQGRAHRRPSAVRPAGRAARRLRGGDLGARRPARRVVSTGAFKLRNGTAVMVNNALAPNRRSSDPAPAEKSMRAAAMQLHRPLHPAPGARDRGQPGDRHRRRCRRSARSTSGSTRAARTPPSPSPPSTSAPAPTWCAASSPRRWSASIAAADGIDYLESEQHAGPLDHHAPGSGSTTTPPRRWPRSAPRSTRSAATCRPRPRSRSSTSSRPTASSPRPT